MTEKVTTRKDYTVAQVAEQFSCGQQTVLNWISKGRIKAYRLGGDGAYRIPWAEVERAKAEWMYKPEISAAVLCMEL
jgi:excisionase family DNA binding protein